MQFSEVYDWTPLNAKDRGPLVQLNWTVLSSPGDYYVKKADLLAYFDPDFEKYIAREVEVCEYFKLHLHPNLAKYMGCLSTKGRVSALYFKRYYVTLEQECNPRSLPKLSFISQSSQIR